MTIAITMIKKLREAASAGPLASHYRVLTWDMRGHGLSQPLRGTLSYWAAAEDIIA